MNDHGDDGGSLPSDLFSAGTEWLRGEGRAGDVVLSSRVRLARNLAGVPFVHRASETDLRLVLDTCRRALESAALGEQVHWVDLEQVDRPERMLLVERHLISGHMAKGRLTQKRKDDPWPRALAFDMPGERAGVMVNEEDHLRLQVIRSGFELRGAWEQADQVDDRVESELEYAFSPRLGYLTACPTNVGTGVRFSVMLHLPGLRMTGDIEKVKRAAGDMSLAVRGFYGEGTEASGDFYQMSNQTTLGKSELQLLEELENRILPEVIDYERRSRQALVEKRRWQIEDGVQRALGVLRHARLLSAEEAMKLLSVLRLGIGLGLAEGVAIADIHKLMLLVQPAHLQRVIGEQIGQDERRRARAQIVRRHLGAEHGED